MSLRAAIHRAIGYIQNQHPINAMNPTCLNSESNPRKLRKVVDVLREQN